MIGDGFNPVDDLLVQLGDLVDGFDHSKEVVSYFKRVNSHYPENVIILRGNHDELMIHGAAFPYDHDQFRVWWHQGGKETWKSYWNDDPIFIGGYAPVSDLMHEHIEWFKTLPTLFETEHYYFVHAGLDPEREPQDTSIYSRLWIRGPFLKTRRKWDKLVIHGHSPVKEPEVHDNRVNVNTRPRNTGKVSGALLSATEPKVLKFYSGPVSKRK